MNGNIGALLKAKRKECQLSVKDTVKELSKHGINISDKTLYGWESGHRQPDADAFLILCSIYGIDSFSAIKQENKPLISNDALKIAKDYSNLDQHGKRVVCAVISEEQNRMQSLRKPNFDDNVIHVHWNDQPASAGEGFDLSDEHMEDWLVRYNELTRKADFCLNIQGHSMEPKFHDGDIALIRQQPAVDIGEIGLFVVDGKGYIKKQGPDRLISLNPDYDDVWPGEFSDAQCVGKVLGVLDPDWIVSR